MFYIYNLLIYLYQNISIIKTNHQQMLDFTALFTIVRMQPFRSSVELWYIMQEECPEEYVFNEIRVE